MTPDRRSATETPEHPAPAPLQPAEPCSIVIFGASGDLSRRKLIPALFTLAARQCLARRFAIIGFARTPMTGQSFREWGRKSIQESDGDGKAHGDRGNDFLKGFAYVSGEYDHPEAFEKLKQCLERMDREYNLEGNRLFYLATPPTTYHLVIEQLERSGLAKPASGKAWTRIVVEKPFGRDLASAEALNRSLLAVFDESQVYRIDHYLGKETVQNLVALRFGNGIFEPLWNRNYVDHVQITAAETLGVERRAAFYETAGATRDMIQSHMLQLTSLVAMEPPAKFDATSVRNEKIKVLQSIRPFDGENIQAQVVRGQYGSGAIRDGAPPVPAYRSEPGVKPDSTTETYMAAKILIDNWRWAGVPFYVRTGKRLAKAVTEIAIVFRRAPHLLFSGQSVGANSLLLNIQPDEGISICFQIKRPGQQMDLKSVPMDFSYRHEFGGRELSAYATLLNDAMRGDATLFDRADGVEAAWALVDPILNWFQAHEPSFPNYAAGSWGPAEADQWMERDGRHWRKP